MAKRQCLGTNKRGQSCGVAPLRSSDYCRAHDPNIPDSDRFGSPEQSAKAGASPKPRALKFREALIAAVEREADSLVARWLEASNATKTVITGSGDDVLAEQAPDYAVQLRALADIWDRSVGKPNQALEITGEDGGPIRTEQALDIADPKLRALAHELLKRQAGG